MNSCLHRCGERSELAGVLTVPQGGAGYPGAE
jgi:hypothetical protein